MGRNWPATKEESISRRGTRVSRNISTKKCELPAIQWFCKAEDDRTVQLKEYGPGLMKELFYRVVVIIE